jgi:hypothetical protein
MTRVVLYVMQHFLPAAAPWLATRDLRLATH